MGADFTQLTTWQGTCYIAVVADAYSRLCLGWSVRPDKTADLVLEALDMAIRHALKHGLPSVTLMHKGNIMKFTEGAFRDWGYQLAKHAFGGQEIDGGPWQKLPNGIDRRRLEEVEVGP